MTEQLRESLNSFAAAVGGDFDLSSLERDGCVSLQFDEDKTLSVEPAGGETLFLLVCDKRALGERVAKAALAECLPRRVGFQLTCGCLADRRLVLVVRAANAELNLPMLEQILQTMLAIADRLPAN